MSSFDVKQTTAPFEDTLYSMLRNHQDAAYYLEDAFEDRTDRHAIIKALKDIILANKDRWVLPLLCVYFSVGHINATKLEQMIDFMEENLNPDIRVQMADMGALSALRQIAKDYRKHGKHGKNAKFNSNLNINVSSKAGIGPGMESAQNALQKALSEDSSLAIFDEMKQVLVSQRD